MCVSTVYSGLTFKKITSRLTRMGFKPTTFAILDSRELSKRINQKYTIVILAYSLQFSRAKHLPGENFGVQFHSSPGLMGRFSFLSKQGIK